MKTTFLTAVKLTCLTLVLLAVLYPLLVLGLAKLTPQQGEGEIIEVNNQRIYANIGQSFTSPNYFWGRPSAASYKADASAASNKGPFNPDYLKIVQGRIDSFLAHHPTVKKSDIPIDMVTASGSGLDPHISVQAARIQVKRIATSRSLAEANVMELLKSQVEPRWLGLFGPEHVNVVKLNLALDQLK